VIKNGYLQRSRSPSAKGCHKIMQKRKMSRNHINQKSHGLLHPVHWVVKSRSHILRTGKLMFPYRTMASIFAFITSKIAIVPLKIIAKSSPDIKTILGASPENLLTALSSNPSAARKSPSYFGPYLGFCRQRLKGSFDWFDLISVSP